jgi:ubiquinone/menaquinone biosynthesis C-methylase UbiE
MEQKDSYTAGNRAAWEEAFENRAPGWGEDAQRLKDIPFVFLEPEFIPLVEKENLRGRHVAQICCNNGRELMTIVKSTGAQSGTGFDISENILAQARANAEKAGIPCTFVRCNALALPDEYRERFDCAVITAGALTWFEHPAELFIQAANILKPGAALLIQEIHPFEDMLAQPCDAAYNPDNPLVLSWPYFKKEPFVDCDGMYYMTGRTYASKPFTCFMHTMGCTITGLIKNGFTLETFDEYERCLSGNRTGRAASGYPMSYTLTARKRKNMIQ